MSLVNISRQSVNSVKRIFKNKNKVKRRIFLKNDITKYNINFANFSSRNFFFYSFNKKFTFFFFKSFSNSNNALFNNNFCFFNNSLFTLEKSYVYLMFKNYFF